MTENLGVLSPQHSGTCPTITTKYCGASIRRSYHSVLMYTMNLYAYHLHSKYLYVMVKLVLSSIKIRVKLFFLLFLELGQAERPATHGKV